MLFLNFAFLFNLAWIALTGLSQASALQVSQADEPTGTGGAAPAAPYTLAEIENIICREIPDKRLQEITDDKLFAAIKRRGIDFELDESVVLRLRACWPETRTLGLLLEWQKFNRPPQVTVKPGAVDVAYGTDVELLVEVYDPDGDKVEIIGFPDCPCVFTAGENQRHFATIKTRDVNMTSGSADLEVGLTVTDYRGHRRIVAPVRIKVRKPLGVTLKTDPPEVLRGEVLRLIAATGNGVGGVTYSWKVNGEIIQTRDASLRFDSARIAPSAEDVRLEVSVSATDGEGARGTASLTISVHLSATLNISTNLDGVTLSVDNVAQGQLSKEYAARIYVRHGAEHEIELTKPGFQATKQGVDKLPPNFTKDLYIPLSPLKPEATQNEADQECVQVIENLMRGGVFDKAMRKCEQCLELHRDSRELISLREQLVGTQANRVAVIPAEATRKVAPDYPAIAKDNRIAGTVVVLVQIDEKGIPTSAEAISGPPLLREAAKQAAMKWRFKPASLGGKPIRYSKQVPFHFNL
ncbi:MAG: energy transducer TonB [Blastocatellia bacterium]